MTTIEYLSLPLYKRVWYKTLAILASIPKGIGKFFSRKVPAVFKKFGKAIADFFLNIYHNFIDGDWKTKTTYLVMGFGQITRGSRVRGIFNLIFQIVYILFMVFFGVSAIADVPTFGNIASSEYFHPLGITVYEYTDNSFTILLIAIFAIVLSGVLIYMWYGQINESMELQCAERIGRRHNDLEVIKDFTGKNYHKLLLGWPTIGLVVFTIVPLIFMILVAFTNYSSIYNNPKELFDWVGMYNFEQLLGINEGATSNQFAATFGKILIWTLIWAFFATFTNYFLGMIVAMVINKKDIKFKKLWRTCLITTIAVPSFISLMFLSKSLGTENGTVNEILKMLHIIKDGEEIKFLEDQLVAKITIIVVNMWIGIPYTMLMCSGLLMNIPADLYESAKIDGASPFKMYIKITLPYMLFVTGPYLISNFVGNINNFNVIYLLSGGGPTITKVNGVIADPNQIYGAGHTDLLITWLYKMCMTSTEKNYALASVIGICIFIVLSSISLVVYSRSSAVKNEEDFQ